MYVGRLNNLKGAPRTIDNECFCFSAMNHIFKHVRQTRTRMCAYVTERETSHDPRHTTAFANRTGGIVRCTGLKCPRVSPNAKELRRHVDHKCTEQAIQAVWKWPGNGFQSEFDKCEVRKSPKPAASEGKTSKGFLTLFF